MNLQPVSNAENRHNPVIPIQFFSQSLNMGVKCSRLTAVLLLPDSLIQPGTAQSYIFIAYKLYQKVKFFHRQIYLFSTLKYQS